MSMNQRAASIFLAVTCLFGCDSGGLTEDKRAPSGNGGDHSHEVATMKSFDQLYE